MGRKVRKPEEAAGNAATKKRREFLKKAGMFGITAPMAALLLSVRSKKASALIPYNGGSPHTYP